MYTAVGANENRHHGRIKRTSPLYSILTDRGAVHGVTSGYEKPLWFRKNHIEDVPTWTRNSTHEVVASECQAVKDAAGIIDISGSSKFEITGADAAIFLDKLSCNQLPDKNGRLGLTLFHAANGGILTEQSITRITENHFYLVGPIGSEQEMFNG